MSLPRIENAQRRLELWKSEARAGVTVRFSRISSIPPEAFYIAFGLPNKNTIPVFSNGGVPFLPYQDQFAGTCRDYYAIDGGRNIQHHGGLALGHT